LVRTEKQEVPEALGRRVTPKALVHVQKQAALGPKVTQEARRQHGCNCRNKKARTNGKYRKCRRH
jgi:hypothetical protein